VEPPVDAVAPPVDVVCPVLTAVTPVWSLVVTVAPRETQDKTPAEIEAAARPIAEATAGC